MGISSFVMNPPRGGAKRRCPTSLPDFDFPDTSSSMPHTTSLNARDHGTRLGGARLRFVESIIDEAEVFHVRRTDTKVDVGYWLGKRRLWACVTEGELLLFARGRRPYIERIPLAELRESRDRELDMPRLLLPAVQVNMRGGELPPAEDNGIRYLKIPLDAV